MLYLFSRDSQEIQTRNESNCNIELGARKAEISGFAKHRDAVVAVTILIRRKRVPSLLSIAGGSYVHVV